MISLKSSGFIIILISLILSTKGDTDVLENNTEKQAKINIVDLFNAETEVIKLSKEALTDEISDELNEYKKKTSKNDIAINLIDSVKKAAAKTKYEEHLSLVEQFNAQSEIFEQSSELIHLKIEENNKKTDEIKFALNELSQKFLENDRRMSSTDSMLKNLQSLQKPEFQPKYDQNFDCLENCKTLNQIPKNCKKAMLTETAPEGIYLLNIPNSGLMPFYANCERRDNQVWTVIQRREDNTVDFYTNWTDYRNGFGNLDGEFWLGLERLHQFTKYRLHELYIRMIDENGEERFAKYKTFSIGDEASEYQLTIGSYSGNAGDSLKYHNGMKFSTSDNRNDIRPQTQSCADQYKGAWWFGNCYDSHLNGQFIATGDSQNRGIEWHHFSNNLKFSEMLIRAL